MCNPYSCAFDDVPSFLGLVTANRGPVTATNCTSNAVVPPTQIKGAMRLPGNNTGADGSPRASICSEPFVCANQASAKATPDSGVDWSPELK
jgi:hypothetical protein